MTSLLRFSSSISSKLTQKLVCTNLSALNIQIRNHGDYPKVEDLHIRWIGKDGKEKVTPAASGATLLQVAHRYGIEMEGACEGVCACSTCHVILSKEVYDSLPEASEKEDDMLDQAFGLTPTSRLGCQVILSKEYDNMSVKLPKATRNFYVVLSSSVLKRILLLLMRSFGCSGSGMDGNFTDSSRSLPLQRSNFYCKSLALGYRNKFRLTPLDPEEPLS